MVPLSQFKKIVYKEPKDFRRYPLERIVGFDSEAYRSGYSFMFCTSKGDTISPRDLLDTLFSEKYEGSNFVVWNLKYESGAILKLLPTQVIKTLQQHHKAKFIYKKQKYEISYIPHKRLSIRKRQVGTRSIRFWDMSPFYGRTRLNTAAKTYLSKSKIEIDPNLFTPEYVESHFEEISRYCIQDAVLTYELAKLWIKKFEETGIEVSNLYSEASISFDYISSLTEIITPWELWQHNRKVVQLAFESYEGGKFEVTARGKFSGYEYDISSAYPHEIANLIDIRGAHVKYSKKYQPEAFYGFMRVQITVHDPSIHLPCGIFDKLRIYPIGSYYITITKQEYDYITRELPKKCVTVKIIEAAWLFTPRKEYPYREIFNDLYEKKTYWKKIDRLRSNNYKIIMNGFYGKMAQCIHDDENDCYRAGRGWNPIYASVVTANTRIAVTRLQNLMKSDCYAVHTDSVITRVPIPDSFLGTGLGKFEFVEKGDGIIVACGVYEINGVCALKGFREKNPCPSCSSLETKSPSRTPELKQFKCEKCGHEFSVSLWGLKKLLVEHPDLTKITLEMLHVESWLQAMAQNHDVDKINFFSNMPKDITLNCDTKRLWPKEITSSSLLKQLQISAPKTIFMEQYPKYWGIKKL